MDRSAGILLPIFSLPSPYGVGSLGAPAKAFVEFLRAAGQSWWQVLPVGPAGSGDSPYQSLSTHAGDPLFLDLDLLAEEGLADAADLAAARVPDGGRVDYAALRIRRRPLLRKACVRLWQESAQRVEDFTNRNLWATNYAVYRAIKTHFDGRAWMDWPDEALRRHDGAAVARYAEVLREEVRLRLGEQYLFARQWDALKAYANGRGVKIIGDLPIYVSLDSADLWGEREQFLLGADGRPTKVAGVPPDYFSEEGQLWGNPLYDWDHMRRDGFGWWIRRVENAARMFDAIRIDHFRGLESYWAVPADAGTAKAGAWERGPGMDLLGVLTSWFPQITYIAEDLGLLTPAVHRLREASGLPGMRVLEFAFSGPDNAYLPHHYPPHCVCYTGTHDNDTALGWYTAAGDKERGFAEAYLGASGAEAVGRALLRAGQGSVAELFVAQMQDYLGLGSEARINVPGTPGGNWRWRMPSGCLTEELAGEIRQLTALYSRLPG